MLYQDCRGRIVHPDELDELAPWEIEDLGLHVYDEPSI
jgi:hypothetical protein